MEQNNCSQSSPKNELNYEVFAAQKSTLAGIPQGSRLKNAYNKESQLINMGNQIIDVGLSNPGTCVVSSRAMTYFFGVCNFFANFA